MPTSSNLNCPICCHLFRSTSGLSCHILSIHLSITEEKSGYFLKELYNTIDAIQDGDNPWVTYILRYNGSRPTGIAPQWIDTNYELNLQDILCLVEDMLANPEFHGQFDTTPFREYEKDGQRAWSNFMSGNWSFDEADEIVKDPVNQGAINKTTVSAGTGHQEYHPAYFSIGNISNTACRAHSIGVLPIVFLPIAKASKKQRKTEAFKTFQHQLYHACLEIIFSPLKPYMNLPKVMKCPDGHYRRVTFSLGPYIADYPEQVWLTGIVQNWCLNTHDCSRCDAKPGNLDDPGAHSQSHEKTDFFINNFDPGILWDEYGICNNVVPFTHSFPRADIHKLLAPDILHQLIKGVFKDHLVKWIQEYLKKTFAVPSYPGLRRFSDGRNFNQWTGDDSKALMKVYLSAVAGYLPSAMVRCLAAFIDACYIARRNIITALALEHFWECIEQFHELRAIFIETVVCVHTSLPRQHALSHYYRLIQLFGSPNGLCSSITESKHIKAVKEPWRRSSCFKALVQMLQSILRMEKMAALRRQLAQEGKLDGSLTAHFTASQTANNDSDSDGPIHVHHSATATFYSPGELCGVGGLHREHIRSSPSFQGAPRCDTVFVELDGTQPGIFGMVVADDPDGDTRMWTVINVDSIVRGAYLLPNFGAERVPERFKFYEALDCYKLFFINHLVDHHSHKLITG
ncbi:hypothetical protein CPB83DRAFT_870278 [Crepidotus variabilis]|uniref:C2H2-type domain-containing protein n=1 Tax=Crepidotus variabilis TaxID=179855 RepID=A0A9P6ED64_9AGAR|nr:hypothetical protein CPB83DRAFT_870278 [Crepidotus variabilis]